MLNWPPRFVVKNTFLNEVPDGNVKGKFKKNGTDPVQHREPLSLLKGPLDAKFDKDGEFCSSSSKEEPIDVENHQEVTEDKRILEAIDRNTRKGMEVLSEYHLVEQNVAAVASPCRNPFLSSTRDDSKNVGVENDTSTYLPQDGYSYTESYQWSSMTSNNSAPLGYALPERGVLCQVGQVNMDGHSSTKKGMAPEKQLEKTHWGPIGSAGELITTPEEPDEAALTTMMLRNVPNRYTQKELVVDLRFLRFIPGVDMDFFYLPIDLTTGGNLGYCFINLANKKAAERFKTLHGERLPRHYSRKSLIVNLATCQGLQANWEHYQRSSVINAEDSRRPLFWPSTNNVSWIPCSDTYFDVPNAPGISTNTNTGGSDWLNGNKVCASEFVDVKVLNFCGSCGQKRGDTERFCTSCGIRF